MHRLQDPDGGYYRGYDKKAGTTSQGIDWNFCVPMKGSGSPCAGKYYAGMWEDTSGSGGQERCMQGLSGSSTEPAQSIKVDGLTDSDLNHIGI